MNRTISPASATILPPATSDVIEALLAVLMQGVPPDSPAAAALKRFTEEIADVFRSERGPDGQLVRPDFDDLSDEIADEVQEITEEGLGRYYYELMRQAYERAKARKACIANGN